ncbi:Arrestin domain-containing protein 3-like 2 [Homarus americanus]|uniref:Arrestin domain-containing protein 3-like 2 n=1 Tax=Homarus americanus TaxID=6706 RepID=A0A8J5TIV0_HOMAM|nr:Arrestin domain-containing protein 3-like 2 [Homarus americanus]
MQKPMVGHVRSLCCLCCKRGPVSLRTQLERTAYVCGESIKLKADIDNQSEEEIRLKLKLVQYVEYFIDRGVLGVTKDVQHQVLEYAGDPVAPGTRWKFDSSQSLVVPVMPPTLIGVCRPLQIYYVLKVHISMSKSGEDLHMHFPITIATVPFRIPNSNQQPNITYSVCCDHVEGGLYTGPEFQLGQVYDGGLDSNPESVLLYRPVYACIPNPKLNNTPAVRSRMMIEEGGSMRAASVRAASVSGSMRAGSIMGGGSFRARSVSGSVRGSSGTATGGSVRGGSIVMGGGGSGLIGGSGSMRGGSCVGGGGNMISTVSTVGGGAGGGGGGVVLATWVAVVWVM